MTRLLTLLLCTAFLSFGYAVMSHAQRGPTGPTPVIVSSVSLHEFSDQVEALGTTKSNETVVITADRAEKISTINFEDGQEVKQGEILLTLGQREETAELQAAQAQLSEAQSAYDRAKGLEQSSALSTATLQERQAALTNAQAAVEAVQARLAKLTIAAPFDGVLGLREVSVGTLVQPGDRITTIDDLSRIKVDFDVPSVYLATLKPGLPIVGTVEAFGKREFKGTVRTVNTQIDPVTRTVKVRAIVPNVDGFLKPGLLMSINLFKNPRRALLIPEEALIKRSDKNFVYVILQDENKKIVKQTEIALGARKPGMIEVLSGLSDGDQIVVHGTLKLRDGAEVIIRAEEKEDTPLGELLKQNPDAEDSTE